MTQRIIFRRATLGGYLLNVIFDFLIILHIFSDVLTDIILLFYSKYSFLHCLLLHRICFQTL